MDFDVTGFMGKDGFVTFYGIVESRNDPKRLGRLQTRIIGWHNPDTNEIPTEDLPWASVLTPFVNSIIEGATVFGYFRDGEHGQEPIILGQLHGRSEHFDKDESDYTKNLEYRDKRTKEQLSKAPKQIESRDKEAYDRGTPTFTNRSSGSTYPANPVSYESSFEDEPRNDLSTLVINTKETKTHPVITYKTEYQAASIPVAISIGKGNQKGFEWAGLSTSNVVSNPNADVVSEYEGVESKEDYTNRSENTFNEPMTKYEAVYPYNRVVETESGHVFEMDDTPTRERIHLFHRVGSFIEFHPDGTLVNKAFADSYELCGRDKFTHSNGGYKCTIEKGMKLLVSNSEDSNESLDIEIGENGNFNILVNDGASINIYVTKGNVECTVEDGNITNEVVSGNIQNTLQNGDMLTSIPSGDFTVSAQNINLIADQRLDMNFETLNISGTTGSIGTTRKLQIGGKPFIHGRFRD